MQVSGLDVKDLFIHIASAILQFYHSQGKNANDFLRDHFMALSKNIVKRWKQFIEVNFRQKCSKIVWAWDSFKRKRNELVNIVLGFTTVYGPWQQNFARKVYDLFDLCIILCPFLLAPITRV